MSFVSDLSTKWRSWETASPADWSTALEREAVIRPLAEQLRLSQAIIESAAQRLRLSRIALYRLLRRYLKGPSQPVSSGVEPPHNSGEFGDNSRTSWWNEMHQT
jgi:hypothetical protein